MGQSHGLHKELLNNLIGKMLTIHGLWSPRSPDVNPCNYYLWGALEGRIYENNQHSLQAM
jgi:hypothetical protein